MIRELVATARSRSPRRSTTAPCSPEKDGLFCERHLRSRPRNGSAPTAASSSRIRYKGVICDRCGVEVHRTPRSAASAWATSNSPAPVVHIWYLPHQSRRRMGAPARPASRGPRARSLYLRELHRHRSRRHRPQADADPLRRGVLRGTGLDYGSALHRRHGRRSRHAICSRRSTSTR
ncbi:MAG: hypothetical protein MZU97_20810 [Bacillus subtilis]|nr:hypothetical protein [Bacillus subtilis]